MDALPDITSANRAIRRYLASADGKIPADTFAKVEALFDSPSPVDAICRSAELLYARRDEIDDDGKVLAGQLASFAATNGWHGMSEGNRGGLMMQALGRKAAKDGDPQPKAEFLRENEPVAPPASDAA